MRALVALVLLSAAGPALATPPVDVPIEVPDEVKAAMTVLTNGKGRFYAAADNRLNAPKGSDKIDRRNFIFVGDGKTFRRMRPERGGVRGGDMYYYFLWDPRVEGHDKVGVYLNEKKYGVYCGELKETLTRLAPADEKAAVAQATFVEGSMGRAEYALARDDRGVYYYVDRSLALSADFRLYVGPRGGMKLQKMKNVVRDSAGDVFASKSGELRLVLDNKEGGKQEGTWVRGKKRTPLIVLPLDDNEGLIYNELGIYVGVPIGSPCDQLGGP
jgi:hypothetical protein